jgi:hypothetical protein
MEVFKNISIKAWLVPKEFSQVEGIDCNETFSLVSKMNSNHLVLALSTSHRWGVHQMDVKSIFFHGDLKEEMYMEQPPDYVQNDSNIVFHLKKSLYGIKKGPQDFYYKMDRFILDIEFYRCHFDPKVYTKKVGSHLIILLLYVYDLIYNVPTLVHHYISGCYDDQRSQMDGIASTMTIEGYFGVRIASLILFHHFSHIGFGSITFQ